MTKSFFVTLTEQRTTVTFSDWP